MKVWKFTVLSMGLAAALALGACNGGGGGESDPAATSNTSSTAGDTGTTATTEIQQPETPSDDGRVLSVAIFEGGFGSDFWYDMQARYEAANPDVTVDMTIHPDINTIMAPRIAVGDVPDFLSVQMEDVWAAMRDAREFRDLTDFFATTEALDRPGTMLGDIIIPGMLESVLFAPYGDGRTYMAPTNAGPMGMVYNRTLFDQMGWDLPRTWDELFAMDAFLDEPDAQLTIGNTDVRRAIFTYQGIHPGYLESILLPSIASAVGVEGLERIQNFEAGAWDNAGVRSVVENLARLGTGGYLMEGTVALDHTVSQASMMMGQALFIPNGTWFINEMADAAREDGFVFAMIPPPAVSPGSTRYVMSYAGANALPTAGQSPDLAFDYLQFLYTRESTVAFAQLAEGNLPLIDAYEIASGYLGPDYSNMLAAYDHGEFLIFGWGAMPEGLAVNPQHEVFDNNMTPLMTGAMSVDEYIARQEEVAETIREARGN